ncbi:MAG: hypothetical protein IPK33_05050 [Gemmatimonadetes bacterium]|nr:hypothetical protein [Gemmatimonadota bacterium]
MAAGAACRDRDRKSVRSAEVLAEILPAQRLDLLVERPFRKARAVAKDEVLRKVREFLSAGRIERQEEPRRR